MTYALRIHLSAQLFASPLLLSRVRSYKSTSGEELFACTLELHCPSVGWVTDMGLLKYLAALSLAL